MSIAAAAAAALWLLAVLLQRPWRLGECLDVSGPFRTEDRLTVVIPARNEADTIASTVRSVLRQGDGVSVIVVDDHSTDETADAAAAMGSRVRVLRAPPRPDGWTGKAWALETGRAHVTTSQVLLLDGDIVLEPGVLSAALDAKRGGGYALFSVMASLSMRSAWEKFLLPPFVFFFRLIYPFERVRQPGSRVAAAAGGFVLVDTALLDRIGGFAAQRDALIDDVALARRAKTAGGKLWLGLSRAVTSGRRYTSLGSVWRMVSRTAYVQLSRSPLLLMLAIGLLVLAFVVPFWALMAGPTAARICGGIALVTLALGFAPLVRYYGLSPGWILTLPLAAVLYMAMTLSSALSWHFGAGPRWKGRSYGTTAN